MPRNPLALLVLTLSLASPALADQTPFDRPFVFTIGYTPAEWLGRAPEYNDAAIERVAQAGGAMTTASLGWSGLEPTPGEWDWTLADEKVDKANAAGLAVLAYIGTTPTWALPRHLRDDPHAYYRNPPTEEHAEAFANYCRTVAARYVGRVNHYLFWNEPNGCSWVKDGCSNMDGYPLYVHWLKRAYTALKEGNPEAVVSAGQLDYHEGVPSWRYVRGMYEEGARGYFDAISIHPYADRGINWQAVYDTRRVMVDHGDADKAVWITEYGWPHALSETAVEDLQQVLRQLMQPEYHYVTMANYLVVNDLPVEWSPSYGLCDRELNPRPIWHAYRDIAVAAMAGATAVVAHTAIVDAPPAADTPAMILGLNNPGFDGQQGFLPPGGSRSNVVAWVPHNHPGQEYPAWWHAFWRDDAAPTFRVVRDNPAGVTPRIDDGMYSAGLSLTYGAADAGWFQRTHARPGYRYRFQARGFVWSACESNVGRSGESCGEGWDERQGTLQLGIDPNGGTDAFADTVLWGPEAHIYDNYADIPAIEAVAQQDSMTVFVRVTFKWPYKHNEAYIDTAQLERM